MSKKSNSSIRPSEGTPGWVIWAGLAVVVVVALVAAVALSGREDKPPIEDEVGVVAVGPTTTAAGSDKSEPDDEEGGDGSTTTSGEATESTTTAPGAEAEVSNLPPFETTVGDPAVGMTLPELHGRDVITGEPVTITDDGRGKIIVAMAHWCPHCQREIPAIVDHMADTELPDGVDIYGVSTGVAEDRGNYPPSRWLEREDWGYPTIADSLEGDAAMVLGTTGFPYVVVVDPSNTVVARASGGVPMETFDGFLAAASGN